MDARASPSYVQSERVGSSSKLNPSSNLNQRQYPQSSRLEPARVVQRNESTANRSYSQTAQRNEDRLGYKKLPLHNLASNKHQIAVSTSPLRGKTPVESSKRRIDSTGYIPIALKSNQENKTARARQEHSKELYSLAKKVEHKRQKRQQQESLFDKEPMGTLSSERLTRPSKSVSSTTRTKEFRSPGKLIPR